MYGNYFAAVDACPACGHSVKLLHVGSLRQDWRFEFRVFEYEKGIKLTTGLDWIEFLLNENIIILYENNTIVSKEVFLRRVFEAQGGKCRIGDKQHYVDKNGFYFTVLEGLKAVETTPLSWKEV